MIKDNIYSEKSVHHWPHLNVIGKNVLDLGCGRHWTPSIYDSSTVYFGENGALKVVSVDASQDEINFFNANNPDKNKYTFICAFINSSEFIKNLIIQHDITVIKCDIEGYEYHLCELTVNDMSNITDIAVEYHSPELLALVIESMEKWGFTITVQSKFTRKDEPEYSNFGSVDVDENKMGVLFGVK
jgi:hypothetical protein